MCCYSAAGSTDQEYEEGEIMTDNEANSLACTVVSAMASCMMDEIGGATSSVRNIVGSVVSTLSVEEVAQIADRVDELIEELANNNRAAVAFVNAKLAIKRKQGLN
jgi:hypothetical protein